MSSKFTSSRYLPITLAASLPCPIASVTVAGPSTRSPPANMPLLFTRRISFLSSFIFLSRNISNLFSPDKRYVLQRLPSLMQFLQNLLQHFRRQQLQRYH